MARLMDNSSQLASSTVFDKADSTINGLANSGNAEFHRMPTLILARDTTLTPPPAHSVRRLLDGHLRTDADLENFCLSYYPAVQRNFGSGMNRKQKQNLLLESVELSELSFNLSRYLSDTSDQLDPPSALPPQRDNRWGKGRLSSARDVLLGGLLAEQLRRMSDWIRDLWGAAIGWQAVLSASATKTLFTFTCIGAVAGVVGSGMSTQGQPARVTIGSPPAQQSAIGAPPPRSAGTSQDEVASTREAVTPTPQTVDISATAVPRVPPEMGRVPSHRPNRSPLVPPIKKSQPRKAAVPLLPDLDPAHSAPVLPAQRGSTGAAAALTR